MALQQNLSQRSRAELRKKRSTRLTEHQQALSLLDEVKKNTGKVIHVVVTGRTTIELPAHLSPDEIKERVETYKSQRKMNV